MLRALCVDAHERHVMVPCMHVCWRLLEVQHSISISHIATHEDLKNAVPASRQL